ncbi:hypothetical protein B7755_001765 [Streptomyces sp. NBS 14/10]|uniref:hypothetical protein n=1 Tax=Streptomyces sp. NBS 14/10 TaxID=1945643 RepID=UPI0015C693D6|nr:hypothetical protein [Streptomyces sp. NBS 14/10]KAK1177006.1 hypothetical protein B7755_001765 [Streptomyces sp. NBS 14/10]
MKEVDSEHGRDLRTEELPPRCISASLECRGYLPMLEDPADRRSAHAVAELEKLTLDALVSPRGVFFFATELE